MKSLVKGCLLQHKSLPFTMQKTNFHNTRDGIFKVKKGELYSERLFFK